MRTTLDIVDILYQVINQSVLKTSVNGNVYKFSRPVNSGKEDIVINSLPITGGQLQEGFVNVNIHVPNLSLNIGGLQDNTQPDFSRLKSFAAAAVGILQEVWRESGDVNFSIQNQSIFPEPEVNEHYVNIRIRYYSVNA